MATKKVEVSNVDYLRENMMKTKREGMVELLEHMNEIGFLIAPCSGGNHLCKEGGLLEHTVNVMKIAEKMGLALLGAKEYNKVHNSVMIAAALHDLGKCGDFGKANYVPNIIKDGRPTKAEPEQKYKLSSDKPFKINPELLSIDHEIRSVKLAAMFIDLTEEEEHAILYHNGLYGNLKYAITGKETPLYMIVHWADMWASRVVESEEEINGNM